jgi:hypothetical protein
MGQHLCDESDASQTMRPDYVVHWTGGKDIEDGWTDVQKSEGYVRLLDSIFRDGLRLTAQFREQLAIGAGKTVPNPHFAACFTEIRLSAAQQHADRYGPMGLVFHREFVLENGGGPVLYTDNTASMVAANLELVRGGLEWLHKHADPAWNLNGWLASNSKLKIDDMGYHIQTVMGLMRSMSNCVGSPERAYELLDEMEWRIIHLHSNERLTKTSHGYALEIYPEDLRMLVFPDSETRECAIEDPRTKDFLARAGAGRRMPMLLLDECRHF